MTTNAKRIATYARVSTLNQEDEQTIQNQIITLKEFAQKNNLLIVKEYADDGWSGDTLIRPDLDGLRSDVKRNLFDAVLIYDPDRLARRYSYQELVMDEMREAGIEVIFITVPAPKNSEDKILYGVRGIFAEYERMKITERFRLGKLRKAKEGHIMVARALYGYDYVQRDEKVNGYYQINESQARVVRMIFSWVADEGYTTRKVAKRLQELGILPQRSKRGVWHPSTIGHLLRHRGYYGDWHFGDTYPVVPQKPIKTEKYRRVKKSSHKHRPESEWIVIPIPPIINKELFDRAVLQLEKNYSFASRNKKHNYLLSGLIWCSCGRRRTGESVRTGKYLYYRCIDRVCSFPLPAQCKERPLNVAVFDTLVWDEVTALMSSPELMMKQVVRLYGDQENKSQRSIEDCSLIEKEVKKLKEHESRYTMAYGSGVFTLEKLSEYVTPLREKISSLENQIAGIKQSQKENNNVSTVPDREEIERFCSDAAQVLPNMDFRQKRILVTTVLEKIIATKEGLQVRGHIPLRTSIELCRNGDYEQDIMGEPENSELCRNDIYNHDTKGESKSSVLCHENKHDTNTIGNKAYSTEKQIPFSFTISLKERKTK